jgi:hypothetical protein
VLLTLVADTKIQNIFTWSDSNKNKQPRMLCPNVGKIKSRRLQKGIIFVLSKVKLNQPIQHTCELEGPTSKHWHGSKKKNSFGLPIHLLHLGATKSEVMLWIGTGASAPTSTISSS